jgi:diguanylate cyclase (GGDEF)-like protein/PAS domain S-box-containing protein
MQQAATTLVSAAGQVRLVTAAAGGLSLIEESRSLSRLSARVVSQIEAAADASVSGLLDREARAALDLSERTACAAVFLAGEAPARGGVVVGSPEPLSPVIARALQTLVGAAGLALGSALATEATHRLQAEARLGSLVRNASDLITVVDTDGAIVYQSPSIARILGYAADDVSGKPFAALLAPRDRGRLAEVLAAGTVGGAEPHTFECLLRHEDGRAIDFEVLATDFLDDEQVRGIVLNGRDISERKALEARIAHQAFHDLVTGLPNRALFDDRVQHALAGLDRERETVGVIFLDLDDFKTVNDSLGHAAGDDVLREIARRLTRTVGASDTAARFGGDEFAVLMDGVASPQEVIDMSDRIVEEFGVPVRLEAQEVIVRPSIGIAIAGPTADGTPMVAEELVRDADAAMYMCKRDRKGGYRIFEPAMHARVHERLTLRIELQRAIELGQFELFFQPLIDLRTGAASGVEALCRWNHPTRGRVMPDEFIPLAEELGLIVDIGRWVLQEGCRQAVAFHATTPAVLPITLGVNISARQLQDPRIVDDVRDALRESGLDATRLILELTETVMMEDPELAAARINELRTLGARIAIDDFGTGYSSLSYLSRFPIDILKMDRSFLAPETPIHATGLAAAIVSLGATLGVEVVAEGIERPDQLAALRELGCDTGQGYLIGRPMDAEATGRWLREHLSEAPSDAMLAA